MPAEVVSARHFDAWWKKAGRSEPDLLTFDPAMLVRDDAEGVSAEDYPDTWLQDDLRLPLTYQFEPGTEADGVTVHVPVTVLNRLQPHGFDWQVPGLRHDLAVALLRSLPKQLRKVFVPAPDTAAAVLGRLGPEPGTEPFTDALARELRAMTGVEVRHAEWDLAKVPGHLRLTFRVERDDGTVAASGKDLDALQRALAPDVRATVAQAAAEVERSGLTGWTFGALPTTFAREVAGRTVQGFPALVDEGASVALRVLGSQRAAQAASRAGVRRLLALALPSPVKGVVGRLGNADKLALGRSPYPSVPALLDDCVTAALDLLVDRHVQGSGPVADEAGFERLRDAVRADLPGAAYDVVAQVARLLAVGHDVASRAGDGAAPAALPSLLDVRAHVARLLPADFVTAHGAARLADVQRYLVADQRRLDVLATAPARDHERLRRVEHAEREHAAWLSGLRPERRDEPAVREVAWMLEELRVSVFAQQLGTPYPVSEKRVFRAMDAATA